MKNIVFMKRPRGPAIQGAKHYSDVGSAFLNELLNGLNFRRRRSLLAMSSNRKYQKKKQNGNSRATKHGEDIAKRSGSTQLLKRKRPKPRLGPSSFPANRRAG
jgi:hypothetical protein